MTNPAENQVPENTNQPDPEQLAVNSISKLMMRANRLPDILSRLCNMSYDQVEETIKRAQSRREPFGKSAVALGYARPHDVQAAIAIQFGHHFDNADNVRVPQALVTIAQPHSETAESFRRLRTRLLTANNGDAARLLSVAGVAPGTGSSYVAANLATSLAQLGRKTLLIDARLRNPQMAKLFETVPGGGVEEIVLEGKKIADALSPCCVRNLSLMAAPNRAPDPQELLCSRAFSDMIVAATDHYESVVVDTTTSNRVADGRFVWTLTKSVLLTAKRNKSRISEVRELTREIKDCDANLIGTVMTG